MPGLWCTREQHGPALPAELPPLPKKPHTPTWPHVRTKPQYLLLPPLVLEHSLADCHQTEDSLATSGLFALKRSGNKTFLEILLRVLAKGAGCSACRRHSPYACLRCQPQL